MNGTEREEQCAGPFFFVCLCLQPGRGSHTVTPWPGVRVGRKSRHRREPIPSRAGLLPLPSNPGFGLPAVRAIRQFGSIAAQMSVVAMCIAFTSAAAFVWALRAQRSEPPSLDNAAAWQWVSATPGSNVYLHTLSEQHPDNHVKAWVAFRTSSSPVSVNADLLELWEFDCREHLSRRMRGPLRGDAAETPPSAWRHEAPETIRAKTLALVCATVPPGEPGEASNEIAAVPSKPAQP